ncbi:MAG: hypothetical protein A3K10_09340 [Bacteroidetes bacterium RIFCSPLOWO2_12_FULL_31_6]|nr:MAG: hypothetical protein A3K10_09340 [Bacteroidetes bacterium RIFCSPLOWO2_12_FULL_31_6]
MPLFIFLIEWQNQKSLQAHTHRQYCRQKISVDNFSFSSSLVSADSNFADSQIKNSQQTDTASRQTEKKGMHLTAGLRNGG